MSENNQKSPESSEKDQVENEKSKRVFVFLISFILKIFFNFFFLMS